jgi:L-glutamine-phosphate cytidylyltransferase
MRAIILAAGPGSRMLPHTEHRPKCLLKIGGHPILHYQIAALRHCGVHDISIVVGYLSEQIKEYVTSPVTFIENREFRTTGSSYSLWLAKESMRDGFLYLNSDLVFHPGMLRALLDSPDENAVIVERIIVPSSDMQKAQMNGRQIVQMGKHLPADVAAAEVVGPAKFSATGAQRIIDRLDRLVAGGDRNRWAYEVFGSLAEEIAFTGVDNPGCFWAEVDTATEALEANQRIPRALVDFADGRISAPPQVERRRTPAIDLQPVHYMDHLLNSHFAPLVEGVPGAEVCVRAALRRNKEEFIDKVAELGVSSLSAIDLHRALQSQVDRMDATLSGVYGPDSVSSEDGLRAMTGHIETLCPQALRDGFCLRENAAAELLQQHPPVTMMDALGYASASELIRGEGSIAAVSLTRATEDPGWQVRYKELLARRTADDFERRPIQFLPVDATRYRSAFMNSKQPRKLWRATHNKEAGVIACLTHDDPTRLRTPCLQYALVSMHYFFETAYASQYYRQVAARDPEHLGRAVVSSIDSHREKLTFFYSNVYSENLFWDKALELFGRAFPGPEIEWFKGASARGEYCLSTGVQNIVVSLNLVDHLWNMNFLGHAGMESFQHDTIYFLYHFRGALWQEVFSELTGLGPQMEELIVANLGVGDAVLTERLLAERRGREMYAASGATA